MTVAGRISNEFEAFKKEMEERIAKLEAEVFKTKKKKEKDTSVVLETENNDIVAFEYDS